jgi:hypothetical protein
LNVVGWIIGTISAQPTPILIFLSFIPLAPELTMSVCSAAHAYTFTWAPYSHVARGHLSTISGREIFLKTRIQKNWEETRDAGLPVSPKPVGTCRKKATGFLTPITYCKARCPVRVKHLTPNAGNLREVCCSYSKTRGRFGLVAGASSGHCGHTGAGSECAGEGR